MYATNRYYYKGEGTSASLEADITETVSNDYRDVITSDRKYFLGYTVTDNGRIDKVYACGVKNDVQFCIEGTSDDSKYSVNKALLQSNYLYGNSCTDTTETRNSETYTYTTCGPLDGTLLSATTNTRGNVFVLLDYNHSW